MGRSAAGTLSASLLWSPGRSTTWPDKLGSKTRNRVKPQDRKHLKDYTPPELNMYYLKSSDGSLNPQKQNVWFIGASIPNRFEKYAQYFKDFQITHARVVKDRTHYYCEILARRSGGP